MSGTPGNVSFSGGDVSRIFGGGEVDEVRQTDARCRAIAFGVIGVITAGAAITLFATSGAFTANMLNLPMVCVGGALGLVSLALWTLIVVEAYRTCQKKRGEAQIEVQTDEVVTKFTNLESDAREAAADKMKPAQRKELLLKLSEGVGLDDLAKALKSLKDIGDLNAVPREKALSLLKALDPEEVQDDLVKALLEKLGKAQEDAFPMYAKYSKVFGGLLQDNDSYKTSLAAIVARMSIAQVMTLLKTLDPEQHAILGEAVVKGAITGPFMESNLEDSVVEALAPWSAPVAKYITYYHPPFIETLAGKMNATQKEAFIAAFAKRATSPTLKAVTKGNQEMPEVIFEACVRALTHRVKANIASFRNEVLSNQSIPLNRRLEFALHVLERKGKEAEKIIPYLDKGYSGYDAYSKLLAALLKKLSGEDEQLQLLAAQFRYTDYYTYATKGRGLAGRNKYLPAANDSSWTLFQQAAEAKKDDVY